jgi:hypothetical protein
MRGARDLPELVWLAGKPEVNGALAPKSGGLEVRKFGSGILFTGNGQRSRLEWLSDSAERGW